jgi:serine/threonine-protein kinase
VLDFGIAKARGSVHQSHDGEIKGKIPYMPPEQLFGEPLDRTVDVYAVGVVLWELLTGERLFDGPSTELLVRRIAGGDVAAPSTHRTLVSPELDALALRALSQEPHARFPTALAMAEQLSAIVALPPRTEIAAWVKRFATKEPPVPLRRFESERRARPLFDPEAQTRRVSSTPPTPPITEPSIVVLPPRPPVRSRASFMVVGALMLGLVAAAFTATRSSAGTTHATAAGAPSPPAPVVEKTVAVVLPVATAVEISNAVAPAPKASIRRELQATRTALHVAPPATVAIATAAPVAEPTPAVSDAKPASCRPPYVVDAEGHRHYKVECL